jgi:hypothetical protein
MSRLLYLIKHERAEAAVVVGPHVLPNPQPGLNCSLSTQLWTRFLLLRDHMYPLYIYPPFFVSPDSVTIRRVSVRV